MNPGKFRILSGSWFTRSRFKVNDLGPPRILIDAGFKILPKVFDKYWNQDSSGC